MQNGTAQHAKQAPLSANDPGLQSAGVASARMISRERLPVFTASGKIPFAVPQTQESSIEGALRAPPAEAKDSVKFVDMWEVPETPQK